MAGVQERGGYLLQRLHKRPGPKPQAEEHRQKQREREPLPTENLVARGVRRGRAAEDPEPAADNGDSAGHRGHDHKHARVGLVAEAARYDQVVGHEGKRAREAETRQAEEQEEGGQSRRVGEPALW